MLNIYIQVLRPLKEMWKCRLVKKILINQNGKTLTDRCLHSSLILSHCCCETSFLYFSLWTFRKLKNNFKNQINIIYNEVLNEILYNITMISCLENVPENRKYLPSSLRVNTFYLTLPYLTLPPENNFINFERDQVNHQYFINYSSTWT